MKATKRSDLEALTRAGLSPIGLSREQAAAYVGVSVGVFDGLVKSGKMPRPKPLQGRLVWSRIEVEKAFAKLPDTAGGRGMIDTEDVFSRPEL